jgi:hypothetical protein
MNPKLVKVHGFSVIIAKSIRKSLLSGKNKELESFKKTNQLFT